LRNREATLLRYQNEPDFFFEDALGITTLEDYQRDALRVIKENNRVVIRACHSVGKTWLLARVALWFFTCFRNSIIISTAPSFKQVEALLWGELRDAYKKSKVPLGGKLLNTKLTKSEKWYAMGFSPQKTAGTTDEQQGSTFQGFHSDHVLIIFDEATGIPPDIWKMAEGLMTSGMVVKFVGIANPTTRACEFFNKFSSAKYTKLHFSCFDSPNLKANGFYCKQDLRDEIERLLLLPEAERFSIIDNYKKPTPNLLSAQWVIDFIMEWGFDHPLVLSKVFGEFPEDSDEVLVKLSTVENAIKKDLELDPLEDRFIGVDVARYGSDKSVITEIIGYKQTGLISIAKRSTTEVTGHVIKMINGDNNNHRTIVLVDATGIGAGVIDNLIEKQQEGIISKKVELIEIHFGASPVNPNEKDKTKIDEDRTRYANLKAKMFQLLANDLENNLDIWDDTNFLKELPTIKSFPDSKGRLRIESKEDYKKRTGRPSPDYADSLALSNLGRYVNIKFGSFTQTHHEAQKPLIKRGIKPRKKIIKATSY